MVTSFSALDAPETLSFSALDVTSFSALDVTSFSALDAPENDVLVAGNDVTYRNSSPRVLGLVTAFSSFSAQRTT